MKKYGILLLLTFLMSCVEEGEFDDIKSACTALGYFNTAQVDLNFKSPVSYNYEVILDGQSLELGCYGDFPCYRVIKRIDNTLRVKFSFREDHLPETIDLIFIEEESGTRIDVQDFELSWVEVNEPNGVGCGVQSRSEDSIDE